MPQQVDAGLCHPWRSSCQDVDQLFALVKAYLKAKLSWEVPEDVSHYLHQQLSPAVQLKGEVMHSINTQGIRSFSDRLKPLQIVRLPSNLAFMSTFGQGLDAKVYRTQ